MWEEEEVKLPNESMFESFCASGSSTERAGSSICNENQLP